MAQHLPNFFIAGAPNAGTTSLYYYLRQHPMVYMSPDKEPTYFGAAEFDAARHGGDLVLHAARPRTPLEKLLMRAPQPLTWDKYLRLFRDVRQETAIGEASVHYLLLPAAARAICSRVPEARLIFILRHPVETQFTRYLRMVWRDPRLSFRRWFLAATERGATWAQGLTAGDYATHLQRFFDVFPREKIQIHLYEDYCADASVVVRSIFAFLGVDPAYPIDVSRQHNQTFVARFAVLEKLRRRVLGGIPVTRWLRGGAHAAVRRIFYRRPPQRRTIDAADRALVIDYYRSEILRTGNLIGRDLSAWLR